MEGLLILTHLRNISDESVVEQYSENVYYQYLCGQLGSNLEPHSRYQSELELYKRVLNQKKDDKHKVYSLHEPEVECIFKGKEAKKYEFGNKA